MGWIKNTSRSRQLAWSWTSMQSLANRSSTTGCCGTPRKAQISAVSAGWALPPKTTISRTLGPLGVMQVARRRVRRLGRRQAELGHDLGLDGLGLGPGVHHDHVLPGLEHLQD